MVRVLCVLFGVIFMARATLANEPILLSAASTATDADRAIVFIHGILGDPRQSFGQWPQIVAADNTPLPGHGKLADMAVYAVDYSADFKSRGTLEVSANSVAQELAASEIFQRHRHVWFVAHSMGGLVLKRTLALWKLQGKNVLLDRVVGIGMLGVPAAGAPLADLVSKGNAGEIARLFGWDGALVQDLTTDSGQRYLDSLENDWLAAKASRDTGAARRFTPISHCGFETKPESELLEKAFGQQYGIVVPKLFAQSSCDAPPQGFSVSHIQLPKPANAQAAVHLWLRNLIRVSVTNAIQEERDQITTSPQVPSYLAARVDFLNQDLKPANLDRATGLPREPELIEYADQRSKQLASTLVLQNGPFTASTKADLLEAVAARNDCIEPAISPNRLNIKLTIRGEPRTCDNGRYSVCPNQSCDIAGQGPPPSPITLTYRVCSGEYERACKAHDVYFYCYTDVAAWAATKCGSHVVQRLETYGGNKCGYSIDSVICTSPR